MDTIGIGADAAERKVRYGTVGMRDEVSGETKEGTTSWMWSCSYWWMSYLSWVNMVRSYICCQMSNVRSDFFARGTMSNRWIVEDMDADCL